MANMDAPSFSLGLDFDIISEPQPDPGLNPFISYNLDPAHLSSIDVPNSSQEEDGNADDSTTAPTTELEREVPSPDRPLKRLRRGPASKAPLSEKACFEVDEDIEEFSSQEDRLLDSNPKQSFSVCSSSKLSLRSRGVLSSQKTHDTNSRKPNCVPNVPSSSASSASNKTVFPELTVSPLRKFQLIDSDSDSDSDSDEGFLDEEAPQGPQLDFVHVPTPSFDAVFEEYFQPNIHNNARQKCDENLNQTRSLYEDNVQQSDTGTLPPAHLYYFHKDPMIQNLVRARLPNYFPLHMKSNVGHTQQNAGGIDYMSQFNHGEASKQAKQKEIAQPSTSKNQKNTRKKNVQEISQGSQSWVNPKSSEIPNDAGKRRVQAASNSVGHWYFDNGRKVYVSRNGQELTGRFAYLQYKKESGARLKKKSKKKASPKKKAAAKKK